MKWEIPIPGDCEVSKEEENKTIQISCETAFSFISAWNNHPRIKANQSYKHADWQK